MKHTAQIEDPSIKYSNPKAVFNNPELSPQEKISILQDWEYQVRQELVAEEESLHTASTDSLHEILEYLNMLGADSTVGKGDHNSKAG